MNKNTINIGDIYNDNFPLLIENNEDDDIYYKLNTSTADLNNNYNLFKNINDYRDSALDDIIQKITNIRNDILSRLNIYKIKKEFKQKILLKQYFKEKITK